MGEHHAPAADPYPSGVGENLASHYLGTRARERAGVVVLGHPVPRIAESLQSLRQGYGVAQSVGGGLAPAHRRLVGCAECQSQSHGLIEFHETGLLSKAYNKQRPGSGRARIPKIG